MFKIQSNIENVIGDILEVPTEMICHQVNCKGVMGAGLAKQIKEKYPPPFKMYGEYCQMGKMKPVLLGRVQFVKCPDVIIANCFGQYDYGTDKVQTDYVALRMCMMHVEHFCLKHNISCISIPYKMGCGLAGGDWDIVCRIIEDVFLGKDIKVQIVRKI